MCRYVCFLLKKRGVFFFNICAATAFAGSRMNSLCAWPKQAEQNGPADVDIISGCHKFISGVSLRSSSLSCPKNCGYYRPNLEEKL